MNLYKINKKLIGNIHPMGETNEDYKRLDNTEVHGQLIISLLNDLIDLRKFKDVVEYSKKEIGKKADVWLREVKCYIDEVYPIKSGGE